MIRFLSICLCIITLSSSVHAQEKSSITLTHIQNGEIKNDKSVTLRDSKDSKKILDALLPVSVADPRQMFWNVIPLKPALSAEEKSKYIALAWKAHDDADAGLINIIHGAPNPGGPYSNNRKSFLHDIQKMAYAVIGAYGTESDISKLLDVAYVRRENGTTYMADAALVAASTIQGRMGLSSKIFIDKANEHLQETPKVAAAYAWAGALYGNKDAADLLLKITMDNYEAFKTPGMWFMPVSIRALAIAPPNVSSLALMRNIADDYNAAVEAADSKTILSVPTPLAWSMPYVLTYLQAYGDATDKDRINKVKILRGSYAPVLLSLAEYPVPLAAYMVDTNIEPKYTRKKLGFDYYCAGLFNRNSKEHFQFYDEFKTLWLDSQPPSSDPQIRDKYANSYELEMSRCNASGRAATLVAGGNNGDIIAHPWIKPHQIPAEISKAMNNMQGNMPLLDIGYFDRQTLSDQLTANKYKDIFMAFYDLIDTQHTTPVEVASGARRAFVRTVNQDTTTLSGIIDVSPRVKGSQLQVGIRFAIDGAIDSSQGFAQAIEGGGYDIVGLQEQGGLPLIDILSLETVADKKEMIFVRTTDSGVHIYEIPYSGDGSNSWVQIFLTAAGDKWPVHVPLYRHLNK